MGNPRGVRRDFEALEKRRLEAVRLVLEEDWSQSQAARRVKAAQQSVSRWVGEYRARGAAGLRQAGRAGRKPLLDAAQLERLASLLLQGPEAHGFPTPLWSCPRVARLIADEFGALPRRPCLEDPAGAQLEPATPCRQSPRAQRRGDPHLEAQDLAGH